LNPDFFITLCELNWDADLNGCELNVDITAHMCLPPQSKKLLAFYVKSLCKTLRFGFLLKALLWRNAVWQSKRFEETLNGILNQSRWHGRALVGLSPHTKLQSPPNLNKKHYKLVEFLSNLYVKPPCTNVKPPYWRLSGDGSALNAMQFSFIFVRLRSGCCKWCLYWYVLKTVF